MLNDTATTLGERDLPDNHRKWAILESFGVHARALRFFFFPSGNVHDTDILATDFFHGLEDQWAKALGPTPEAFGPEVVERLNREFAHLSYDRLLPDRPTRWDVTKIQRAVNGMVDTFRTNVRPELLHWMWTNNAPTRLPALPGPMTAELARAASLSGQQTAISTTSPPMPSGLGVMCNTPAFNPGVVLLPPQGPLDEPQD